MKTLSSILIFSLTSFFAMAQETEVSNSSTDADNTSAGSNNTPGGTDDASAGTYKYFVSTNSALLNTPVGFRVGVLKKTGGYIATRFGKGNHYEEDRYYHMEVTEATFFSATAGFIFPITTRHTFKIHTFLGLGYGKWFDRPSKSGQTMGGEFEGGFMLSYNRLMLNFGGTMLTGDGNSPKGDMTLGVGLRF